MEHPYSNTVRRLGIWSAAATAILILAYAVTLVLGLLLRSAPTDPIRDPMFTILEVLIIALVPTMIGMVVAIHGWCPARLKVLALLSIVFMAMMGVITSGLHFFILIVNRQPEFASLDVLPLIVEFRWPSVAYVFDILAWDVFFAISMLFGAAVFRGDGREAWVRRAMVTSGVLALAGLSGVIDGNMGLRNIGVVGYVGVFFVVAVLVFLHFRYSQPEVELPGSTGAR